ncbi:hypothetical protein EJF18_50533 [Clavispora lusitaniae]|uniref:Uncharacterized protein n=1 Tax=Clavispora lusitaniae TaxID=36911 RepID=A0ACD0WP54_CLALS|nr:hypothetical protein EJF14_50533 [Clavispora lusitaniae]QFZ34962.1 hypothetical protein EJF16_50533 [Clavispora lusitaniae]QFZ40647.1 hypothetical protein EJF15_50533 [Clavispora lusitaniae]QFZ46327.1 hypothetical protein EJF18_50533 [Clavispora lusitaniae]QFZ51989.1 hypothetical protein EJF17_50533 [Clavispora lusitaniae]
MGRRTEEGGFYVFLTESFDCSCLGYFAFCVFFFLLWRFMLWSVLATVTCFGYTTWAKMGQNPRHVPCFCLHFLHTFHSLVTCFEYLYSSAFTSSYPCSGIVCKSHDLWVSLVHGCAPPVVFHQKKKISSSDSGHVQDHRHGQHALAFSRGASSDFCGQSSSRFGAFEIRLQRQLQLVRHLQDPQYALLGFERRSVGFTIQDEERQGGRCVETQQRHQYRVEKLHIQRRQWHSGAGFRIDGDFGRDHKRTKVPSIQEETEMQKIEDGGC